MEKCLLTHWCNYLSWINICSQARVPSPLQHVPVPCGSAGYVYLCLFPNAVYLGTRCSNFSLWHPPPIQHLRIYVNILAAVIENTNVVTPPNQFFQFNHDTAAQVWCKLFCKLLYKVETEIKYEVLHYVLKIISVYMTSSYYHIFIQ